MAFSKWIMLGAAGLLALAAGCGSTTTPTCDGGAALADGACPVANPIEGTWTNNTVSASDMTAGVATSQVTLTFAPMGAFNFATTKTFTGTATMHAGCTEVITGMGAYTLSGTNTIAMLLSGATVSYSNCASGTDNLAQTALNVQQLAYVNTLLSVTNTYTVSGTILTLSYTGDAGASAAAVYNRSM